ncbi:MAG: AAA family ATPase [Candidatus Verstraetearchaeota archaeon]|nr:AAA family ATPase [Candidatus Verstraetearchaeota archaeon]
MLLIRLKLGLPRIDEALEGGLRRGELTLFCGEPGSGKTALTLQLASKGCHEGLRVLYVYSDGLFPYPRLELLARKRGAPLDDLSSKFYVLHLKSLEGLINVVRRMELALLNYDLVIFDTFTAPYRSIKVENKRETVLHNKKLNQIAAILKKHAIDYGEWVVLTSRLRSPATNEEIFEDLVASNVLTYWSDNIVSVAKTDLPHQRKISLLKIHGQGSRVEVTTRVVDGFLEEVD